MARTRQKREQLREGIEDAFEQHAQHKSSRRRLFANIDKAVADKAYVAIKCIIIVVFVFCIGIQFLRTLRLNALLLLCLCFVSECNLRTLRLNALLFIVVLVFYI